MIFPLSESAAFFRLGPLGAAVRRGLFTVLLLSLTTAARPPAPPLPPLVLRAVPLALNPPQFSVAAVTDARADRQAVAYLLPPPVGKNLPGPAQAVDLAGGALTAVQAFVRQSVSPSPQRRPVIIRLTECLVTEKPAAGTTGQVEGRVTVAMAFDWQRNGQTVHLTDYRGAARYVRPAGQLSVVEPTLSAALGLALTHLNRWLQQAEGQNPKLALGIRAIYHDYIRNTDPDTLFYDPARPLTRADFLGVPRPGHYAAAVFPGFSFSARPTFARGFVYLDVETKVYIVRASSWMGVVGDETYVLNHEQRHFDLAKLVAERFKQQIQPARLSPDDFNATIQLAYFTGYQELSRLQEQYDTETGNGTNGAAQQRWNQRIDAELRAFATPK